MKPYHDKFDQLQTIQKANYEKNQKLSLVAFNDDFNNLDKKLELLINERNILIDKKNQFALNKDLAYRFGINNDIDDSSPIKERLLVIEEALKESNN